MRPVTAFLVGLSAALIVAGRAEAQIELDGWFIALRECPAYQSFRQETNPGNVRTILERAYPLHGKNAHAATHFLIEVRGASPSRRWVSVSCGVRVVAAEPTPVGPTPTPGPGEARGADAVLAVSWEPAFCETKPSKPECTSMTDDRFDATHLSLHGLWPQGGEYCQVPQTQIDLDKAKKWDRLPPLTLTSSTREMLERVMPGTQSHLERHEWTRHGSCYGTRAEEYFRDTIALVVALNESPLRAFLANRIGTDVSTALIRDELDRAFGTGAGERASFVCEQDGGRRVITEIRINVRGTIDETTSIGDLMLAARTANRGCTNGIIDPAGLQ